VDSLEVRLGTGALSDLRLVCDHDCEESRSIETSNGLGGAGEEFELGWGREAVFIDVEGAVSVQEDGGAGTEGGAPHREG